MVTLVRVMKLDPRTISGFDFNKMASPLGNGAIEASDWLGVGCQDGGRLPVSLSKSKMAVREVEGEEGGGGVGGVADSSID